MFLECKMLMLVTTLCIATSADFISASDLTMEGRWISYKARHKKEYELHEENMRRAHFEKADATIRAHNKENRHSWTMGHNQFSDWTESEISSLLTARPPNGKVTGIIPLSVKEVPSDRIKLIVSKLDYRSHSCMPPVKNQGNCGSCWTFAAITPIEFQYCDKFSTKKIVSFSEQQLIDCDRGPFELGCEGGFYDRAWKYLMGTPKSMTRTSYPYKGVQETCKYNASKALADVVGQAWISSSFNPEPERIANVLVQRGPLAVAFEATAAFMKYKGGVFSDTTCSKDASAANHAVVAVGFGTDSTAGDYWIVRNSWGTGWGINGYFLIKRGVNMCNIERFAAFPMVVA